MHFLTEYLVAVLISTEVVVRARQMKVGGAVAQLRGHGRGPPEHCNRAGLTWNTAKDDKKKNQQEHKIDEQSSMGSLDVAVPVGREADMAEVGLIQSLDGELICGVAVLLIFKQCGKKIKCASYPENCLPFYKNQTHLHVLIIASYCATLFSSIQYSQPRLLRSQMESVTVLGLGCSALVE